MRYSIPAIAQHPLQGLEMQERSLVQVIQQLGRGFDQGLQSRVLAVQHTQGLVCSAAWNPVQQIEMLFKVVHQPRTMASAILGAAQRVDFQRHVFEAKPLPQACGHDDLLGVDIRPREAQGFHTNLMKLAVASLLRALVAEHRPHVPQTLRRVVQQIVLQHARTQEAVPSGRSVRLSPLRASVKVYISFSTMSVTSPMARLNSPVCSTMGMRMHL